MSSFVVANLLIDVEVLWYIFRRDPPLHRLSHTNLIGLLFGVLSGVVTWLGFSRFVKRTNAAGADRRPFISNRTGFVDSLMGGVIGGLSHVLLDSLLYREMNPFWPFVAGNTLAGTVGNGLMHGICAGVGVLGVALWWIQRDAFP